MFNIEDPHLLYLLIPPTLYNSVLLVHQLIFPFLVSPTCWIFSVVPSVLLRTLRAPGRNFLCHLLQIYDIESHIQQLSFNFTVFYSKQISLPVIWIPSIPNSLRILLIQWFFFTSLYLTPLPPPSNTSSQFCHIKIQRPSFCHTVLTSLYLTLPL